MTEKNRILIMGGSGFIGTHIYQELRSFYDCYGTFCSQQERYESNQVYSHFDATSGPIDLILKEVAPTHIISCFAAPEPAYLQAHKDVIAYLEANTSVRLIYISSVVVFDGNQNYPSYEETVPSTVSAIGKRHLAVERLLRQLPAKRYSIARLPLVLGVNAPMVVQLKQAIKHEAPFEVFPNIIVSVTTIDKVCQQMHYIINRELHGIYHLASEDLIHHDDLFYEIASALGDKMPIFKKVYSSNDDAYLAVLPKAKKLPKTYQITTTEVIDACTLFDEISTLKNIL
ncbi:sugar nucleotide-binding protein [Altibacter sp. HG106]|uniref:sugar nucleotide-binding protein n=1 Tax=Altibacter sp. HG106 TaxID=3023937 RepID=UPI00235052F4|nr:sugar nucleotide-binding protein [Altibacter sp. HG106]MDC7996231.1 sugar nucleotide-binding protein [Altibacter sp. HG106]